MSDRELIVLKFGSSILRTEGALPSVASEIERYAADGGTVVVVVSAIGDTTDSLLGRAERLGATRWRDALAAPSRSTDFGGSGLGYVPGNRRVHRCGAGRAGAERR